VNAERMRSNFEALLGLTMSEAVSAALAPKIGRATVHELLRKATARAASEKRHLGEIIKLLPEFTAQLSSEEIDRLMDPRAYLGSATRFIERVLGEKDAGH
jgi:3-carboxy-cis,cis-muconate cycloisomerase